MVQDHQYQPTDLSFEADLFHKLVDDFNILVFGFVIAQALSTVPRFPLGLSFKVQKAWFGCKKKILQCSNTKLYNMTSIKCICYLCWRLQQWLACRARTVPTSHCRWEFRSSFSLCPLLLRKTAKKKTHSLKNL